MTLFTISIAVHDRADMTRKCLDSVIEHSPQDVEILVWNNASDAETGILLARYPDRVKSHRSDRNIGFGQAHVGTLQKAKGTYFVVLNNDVEVCPGWLDGMRQVFLDDPKVGIVGPASSACKIGKDGMGSLVRPELADYVEGSCFMIPRWLACRFHLFDPIYEIAYCEDSDLSLRLRKRGWNIGFAGFHLQHHRGATADLVMRRKEFDIKAIHKKNHETLCNRWSGYMKTRSFREKILISRSVAHGDVLLATPIIRAFKEMNAHAEVCVQTNCGSVLDRNRNVYKKDPIFRSLLAKGDRFDATYDLNLCYESDPKKHVIQAYAERCGLKEYGWLLDLKPSRAHRNEIKKITSGIHKLAVMHPGVTAWPGRNWHQDRFGMVASWLMDRGWAVAIVGVEREPHLTGAMDCRGWSISQTTALMERAGLFVGIDSFPMHIAQATLTPLVAIFGAIKPSFRLLPFPFFQGVVAKGVECLGCHHDRPGPLTQGTCHRDRQYCMDDLTVDSVLVAIEKSLEAKKMFLETSKIRDKVIKYCEGHGIDIGCGRDKIRPEAVGFDDDDWPEVDVLGDASGKMPFKDGEFDYVYSSHALEDIADTAATLSEWTRILKIKGNLILQVPNPDHYKGFNADHKHDGWRPGELAGLVALAGCQVMDSFADVGDDRYSTVVVAQKT